MIVAHEEETKSTQKTSLKVIILTWPISLTNAEMLHILGTVMELRIGITLKNTVLEIILYKLTVHWEFMLLTEISKWNKALIAQDKLKVPFSAIWLQW